MGRLYTPGTEMSGDDIALPSGLGADQPIWREVLTRLGILRDAVRGTVTIPPTGIEVVPGGTSSTFTVRVPPFAFVDARGFAGSGARRVVRAVGGDLARTDFYSPPASLGTGAWYWVVAQDNGSGVARMLLTGSPPADPPWNADHSILYLGAFPTDATTGAPIGVMRTGRRSLYHRWYAETPLSDTRASAGNQLWSLAARVPVGAKRVLLEAYADTGGDVVRIGEASETGTDLAALSTTPRVLELPLSADREIRLATVGGGGTAYARVMAWEE